MATLSLGTNLTLAEIVRREDPDGSMADLVNAISQVNEIVVDMTWVECNKGTAHEKTRVATEPAGQTRIYNQGITREAGVTEKITEPIEMLDGLSVIDDSEIQHSPSKLGVIQQEDQLFVKGMTKTFVSRFFDSDRAANPAQIVGINQRSDYNALSSSFVFDNAKGNASATANKSSIYIIQWGPKMVNMIHPRNDPNGGGASANMGNLLGSVGPIKQSDFGIELETDSRVSAAKFPAHRTWFSIHFGIMIEDARMIKRIVNISTSNIDGVDDFSFDEEILIDAISELENGGMGAVIYANRTIIAQIRKRSNEKGNAHITDDREGEGTFAKKVTRFDGIKFAEVAQITNAQSTVS